MNIDERIAQAVDRGQAEGLAALNGWARDVFVVSEAELHCDKDGIDSFLDLYGVESGLKYLLAAYRAVGASRIVQAVEECMRSTPPQEEDLGRLNDLITDRADYSYENIRTFVAGAT